MLFLLNIKFISLVRQHSVTFSLVLRTHENITEFCLTREINLIFNKTTLNILYMFCYNFQCNYWLPLNLSLLKTSGFLRINI